MKRTTGFLIAGGFGCAVALMLYGMHWYYRVPVEREGREALGQEAEREVETDFVPTGMMAGAVPSIDNPQFESVGAADVYLNDDGFGLDVEVGGKHRFYPYQLLVWHQVVNDLFDDRPIVVTYAPLTFTGSVFDLSEMSERPLFHVSENVWNNNLLMIDTKTSSFWSQILGRAVLGEADGQFLKRYPSSVMSWDVWKLNYPNGQVLSRETGADRDYTRDPYDNYLSTQAIWYPLTSYDDRLPAKTIVYGLSPLLVKEGLGEVTRYVFPLDRLIKAKEVKEEVGGLSFIVRYNEDLEAVEVYQQEDEKDGELLSIESSFWFLEAAAFQSIVLYELP